MRQAGWLEILRDVDLDRVVRRDERRGERDEQQDEDDHAPDEEARIPADDPPHVARLVYEIRGSSHA